MVLGFKKKPDEQIRKEQEKALDVMLKRSARLKKLISKDEAGWLEFVDLLNNYIEASKKRKAVTALDLADEKTIYQLKLLDHEIFILKFVMQMPTQFINKVEERLKQKKQEESNVDG